MKGFHVLPIYGGQSYTPQLKGLKRGAHVIVGTPGRVMDHMKRGSLPLEEMSFLVLDEADRMLDMGFIQDIRKIVAKVPAKVLGGMREKLAAYTTQRQKAQEALDALGC